MQLALQMTGACSLHSPQAAPHGSSGGRELTFAPFRRGLLGSLNLGRAGELFRAAAGQLQAPWQVLLHAERPCFIPV